MNAIPITGHRANTAPAAALSSASPTGIRQTPIETRRPTTIAASDACHAGRRNTPSITSSVRIGREPTRNDRNRLPPTGARS